MTPRQRLEALIDQAIELLDQLDGDHDLEDGGDAEPSLGWTKGGALGTALDLELSDCPV